MNKKLLLALSLFIGIQGLQAQDPVYFTGYGRALVTNDSFQDSLESQTGKASGGYTLFDLGVYAQSGEALRGGAILRLRNEFGGFFGDGSAFEFRQMLLEGLIGKIVKYQIGDVDLVQTKYTIYNTDLTGNEFESPLFKFRRDIINYENFYTGDNTWRMQGVNAKTTLNFASGIDKLGIWLYGNRVVDGTLNNGPDRFLYGGSFDLSKSTQKLGLNWASVSDIAGTTASMSNPFKNDVFTADFDFNYGIVDSVLTIGLMGEGGISSTQYVSSTDSIVNRDDYFYDLGIYAKYEPINLTFSARYKNVGNDFNSPAAQTRRIDDFATPSSFPTYNSDGAARSQNIFDRMTQEQGMYNRGISSTLMGYNPLYGNINPYGEATPNRTGMIFGLDVTHPEKFYKVALEYNMLQEDVQITLGKRTFTGINAGGYFDILKTLGKEKSLIIMAGISTQSTESTEDEVDLSTTMLDASLDWEFYQKLHLLVGYKSLVAEGSEYMLMRDEINQVTDASVSAGLVEWDQSQDVLAVGFRYDFSTRSAFAVQGQFVGFENNLDTTRNYDWTQWFFNYTLQL